MVKVMRSIVRGPLVPFVAGFAAALLEQGYTRNSAEQHVCFVTHLDRWLLAKGLGVKDLNASTIKLYLVERRAAGFVEYRSDKAMRPLLEFLSPLGVLPPKPSIPRDPVEDLLVHYGQYLRAERGLAPATVGCYVYFARGFIVTRFRGDQLDLAGLTAADVIGFVLISCPGRDSGSAKLIVTVMRSLLSWLHLTGRIPVSLAAAVPSVAGWSLSGLPQALTPVQVRALWAACDRRTRTGRRDFAIMLMLSRLGLRAGEVAALGLDDIDWRGGEVRVLEKANRAERLPLPADVGAAITAYLKQGTSLHGAGTYCFRPCPRSTPGVDYWRYRQCCQRCRTAGWAGACPCPPVAPHCGHVDVAGWRLVDGGGSGAAAQVAVEHRDLRQGRPGRFGGAGPALAGRPEWVCVVTGPLREALGNYLRLRRALGYRLVRQEKLLGQFLTRLEATGQEVVDLHNALEWARLPAGGSSNWWGYRLSAVRGFATYLNALDPAHQVPPAGLLAQGPHRATPFLYSDDDIAALMACASSLRTPLRRATTATLIGLLAVTGMGVGEAIALDRSDIDLVTGGMLIRHGKFDKSRRLWLHPTTSEALTQYQRLRDKEAPPTLTTAFFVSSAGTRLLYCNVHETFHRLVDRVGLEPRSSSCRPRIHDLRHSFTVRSMVDAYATGEDGQTRLSLLSTWLGHVDPASTYWYLSASPELMATAGQRLETYLAGRP